MLYTTLYTFVLFLSTALVLKNLWFHEEISYRVGNISLHKSLIMSAVKFIILGNSGETTPNGATILQGVKFSTFNSLSESLQEKALFEFDSLSGAAKSRIGVESIYCSEGIAKVALKNGDAMCTPSNGKNGGYTVELPDLNAAG